MNKQLSYSPLQVASPHNGRKLIVDAAYFVELQWAAQFALDQRDEATMSRSLQAIINDCEKMFERIAATPPDVLVGAERAFIVQDDEMNYPDEVYLTEAAAEASCDERNDDLDEPRFSVVETELKA